VDEEPEPEPDVLGVEGVERPEEPDSGLEPGDVEPEDVDPEFVPEPVVEPLEPVEPFEPVEPDVVPEDVAP
jgi:hypothetical protein